MEIRKAKFSKQDCDIVFSLSNDPLVRNNSFNQNTIEYSNHCEWFKNIIADNNTLFFLVFSNEREDSFIGQIRFRRGSEDDNSCTISLSITEQYRGKHIASEFIELGISELKKNWDKIKIIIAEVKDENLPSNKLFLKENFELVSKVNTYHKVIK